MAFIDYTAEYVHHKGRAYPFADFTYKTTGGHTDFGVRLFFVPAMKGHKISDEKVSGEATGKVEHYLCRHGADFYRFECRLSNGQVKWIIGVKP